MRPRRPTRSSPNGNRGAATGVLVLISVLVTLVVLDVTGPTDWAQRPTATSSAQPSLSIIRPLIRRALALDSRTSSAVLAALAAHPQQTRITCRRAGAGLRCQSVTALASGVVSVRLWLVNLDPQTGIFSRVRIDPLDRAVVGPGATLRTVRPAAATQKR